MANQRTSIISAEHKHLWRLAEPSIWTVKEDHAEVDPALPILRTLLDQPPWLEARYLYDERGSELFERICTLPEYYLTRTENSILTEQAGRLIEAAPVECIAELGAGSSQKTVHLLREHVRQRGGGIFAPIDVSLKSLEWSRDAVKRQFPELRFHGLHAGYETGFASIDKDLPTLFVFLGSSLGNFMHAEFIHFFQRLSEAMGPSDFFLLGVDRVKKTSLLEKAYDDSQGVTAEFILNVFSNINRVTGGNFDAKRMRYECRYNPGWQWVEMFAVATARQEVRFPSLAASLGWEKDSPILVEVSRKFEPVRLQQQLRCFGLKPVDHFTDRNEWFSVLLFGKV